MNNYIQVFDFKNKAISIALLIACFAINCNETDENRGDKDRKTEDEVLFQFYNVDVRKWRAEYIEEDSFLINGVVPPVVKISLLKKHFGEPQAVINNNIGNYLIQDEFPNQKLSCFIYNINTVFDVFDSLAILRCITFDHGNKVYYKNNIFDNHALAKDIQKIFPESGKLIRENGHGYEMISVPLSKNITEVQKVVFLFKNSVLDKILLLPMMETKFM